MPDQAINTVFSPNNSFVKINQPASNNCSVDVLTCLPFKDGGDLKFQIKVRRGWLVDQDIPADAQDQLDRYKARASTACFIENDAAGIISGYANQIYVLRKNIDQGYSKRIVVSNPAWIYTNFSFTSNGAAYSISIPNLTFANNTLLAAYLQTLLDTNAPDSHVIVEPYSTTGVKFFSQNINFTPDSITNKHLFGGSYVFQTDYNLGFIQVLYQYELTIGFDFTGVSITIPVGQSFTIAIGNDDEYIFYCTNCFCKIEDDYCYTTHLEYWSNEEDSLGFSYGAIVSTQAIPEPHFELKFTNKIRLPFYLTAPQYPETAEVFRKSNGVYQKIASRLEEEYLCKTDYLPKEWHKCVAVSMAHDEKVVGSDLAGITNTKVEISEKVNIDWLERPYLALAMANFKLKTMPFNYYNSNI